MNSIKVVKVKRNNVFFFLPATAIYIYMTVGNPYYAKVLD